MTTSLDLLATSVHRSVHRLGQRTRCQSSYERTNERTNGEVTHLGEITHLPTRARVYGISTDSGDRPMTIASHTTHPQTAPTEETKP